MINLNITMAGIIFIAGVLIGGIIHYYTGKPKCKHEWEKIIDERLEGQCEHGRKYILHTTVHMCKKCGKRKVTKV